MYKILNIVFIVIESAIIIALFASLMKEKSLRKKEKESNKKRMDILLQKEMENKERKENIRTGDSHTDFGNSVDILHELSQKR